jgi:hypothetical protein
MLDGSAADDTEPPDTSTIADAGPVFYDGPTPSVPPLPSLPIEDAGPPAVIAVDVTQTFGPLKKGGLGSLFGITSMPDTPADLAASSHVWVSEHMMLPNLNGGEPAGTAAVAAKVRAAGLKMVARYNDLMGGNPWYQWSGLPTMLTHVTAATQAIQQYKDVLYAVAPFNEPDNSLHGLENDTAVPGSTYDAKFNYVWTQAVRAIRAVDTTIPIMGPNFEFYLPWNGTTQTRMHDFLANAVATGTAPDLIAWHNLGPSPGDVYAAMPYYRSLEQSLGVPKAPLKVVIEEYGPQTTNAALTPGNFEGVPGTMVKYWADFERVGVDYGSMGIYTNEGLLGNTLRHVSPGTLAPNAGSLMMQWYKAMAGARVFVSRWDTRAYVASDGVASWDAAGHVLTVLAGGEDDDVDVQIAGLGTLGFGQSVRVRLDEAVWSKDPNEVETRIDCGGDPQSGPLNVLDKTVALGQGGTLTVPIRRMALYDGYRILVSAPAAPDAYPTKLEAEQAQVTAAVLHQGSDAWLASGGGFVAGLDSMQSAVTFDVDVAKAGIYVMTVRYANASGGTASHFVTVNGELQGFVAYEVTPNGWSANEMALATKRVVLAAGHNVVTLSKGAGSAELDFIDVRPDTHRYEAESARITDASADNFWSAYIPTFVGQINNADSAVEFALDAPVDGTYRLTIGYGNGTTSTSTHLVLVGGVQQAVAEYAPTMGWLSTPTLDDAEGTTSVLVTLKTGVNAVTLQKGTGYAELDYVTLGLP